MVLLLDSRHWRDSWPAPSPLSFMSGFKLCNDGELLPQDFPCPPPFSPFPYYPPAAPIVSDTDHGQISLSTGAIAGIVILIGLVFVLGGVLMLKCAARSEENRGGEASRRRESQATGRNDGLTTATTDSASGGLDDILVKLLPVCPYRPSKLHDSSRECAVCLSSFEEEEVVRILPRCQHTFHLPCIDKWFESHANCPLCREKITLQIIEEPELPVQSSVEIAVDVPMRGAGGESNERGGVEQGNSAASEEVDSGTNGATFKSDTSRSMQGGIRSFPGSRCEDCCSRRELRSLKSVRTDQFWINTAMAGTACLRRSYSTGSVKLEMSWGDRHSRLLQGPCCSRPARMLMMNGLSK